MERQADSGAGGRRLLPKRHFMVKMLCEAASVEPERSEYDGLERDEKQAWLSLFAETLMDRVSKRICRTGLTKPFHRKFQWKFRWEYGILITEMNC